MSSSSLPLPTRVSSLIRPVLGSLQLAGTAPLLQGLDSNSQLWGLPPDLRFYAPVGGPGPAVTAWLRRFADTARPGSPGRAVLANGDDPLSLHGSCLSTTAVRHVTAERLVVVGGGPAALEAARAYREAGAGGQVVLVSADEHLPYDRPPLSKDFLRGESEEDALLLEDAGFYRRP